MIASLHITGITALRQHLRMMGYRAKYPAPGFQSPGVRRELLDSEKRQFNSERGWKPDTPDWITRKRRQGLDTRIMRATTRLYVDVTTGSVMRLIVSGQTATWTIAPGRDRRVAEFQASPRNRRRVVIVDEIAGTAVAVRMGDYVVEATL